MRDRNLLSGHASYNYETTLDSKGFRTIQDNLRLLRNVAKIGTPTRMSHVPLKEGLLISIWQPYILLLLP
jgi:hypothetical protein